MYHACVISNTMHKYQQKSNWVKHVNIMADLLIKILLKILKPIKILLQTFKLMIVLKEFQIFRKFDSNRVQENPGYYCNKLCTNFTNACSIREFSEGRIGRWLVNFLVGLWRWCQWLLSRHWRQLFGSIWEVEINIKTKSITCYFGWDLHWYDTHGSKW